MKGLQKMEARKLLMILPIILALVLLANVNSVKAQNFDYITLYQSQSATVSTSQVTPIGSHYVFVTSIGNRSLSAGITGISSGASGFWTILLVGTGLQPVDLAGGIVPWSSGLRAQIPLRVDRGFNWGFIITTLYLTTAEDSVNYTISIGQ